MASHTVAFEITLFCLCFGMAYSVDFNFPAVFNFGDSNSDTGDLAAGLGFQPPPPYGQTFFKTPSDRFCDGRLIVDFLGKFLTVTLISITKYQIKLYAKKMTRLKIDRTSKTFFRKMSFFHVTFPAGYAWPPQLKDIFDPPNKHI
ncbi:hypothetical protein K1719_033271 [Acacia pycnantha]|nr:hypothetical protein K1719_033271 [Acacia pycnantha]